MTFTEKGRAEALRLQRIDEDSQTDKIEMIDVESMTEDLIQESLIEEDDLAGKNEVEEEVFSKTNQEIEQTSRFVDSGIGQSGDSGLSEHDWVDQGSQVGNSHWNLQTSCSQTDDVADPATEEVDSLKVLVAELEEEKLALEEKLEAVSMVVVGDFMRDGFISV